MRNAQGFWVTLAVLLIAVPEGLDSCAISGPDPVFFTRQRPADLKRAYTEGKLGILVPSYETRHLIAAYRVLHGVRYSDAEIQAAFGVASSSGPAPYVRTDAVMQWEKARALGSVYVSTYKSVDANNVYYNFLNCNDDAFLNATATLQKRQATWGATSQNFKDWVDAQDQVFSNCAGNKNASMPSPTPDGADRLLAEDRHYQIAAANFYAGDYAKARDEFSAIAKDAHSPWRDIAPYLVARCYLREGTVLGKRDALEEAGKRFHGISNNPSAAGLADFTQGWLDPIPRLAKLETKVSDPADLADYVYLYHSLRDNRKLDKAAIAKAGDLTDWLLSMEVRGDPKHAADRWRETKRPEWLIAALMFGTQGDDVLQAARRIPASAPEYEAVAFYGIGEEKAEMAREWADEALKRDISVSTRNSIRGERMTLAVDWKEFLTFAPRLPEPNVQNFDGKEEAPEPGKGYSPMTPLFDQDAAKTFNVSLPVAQWIDASTNHLTPPGLQVEIAQAAWMRATLLEKADVARKAMERLADGKQLPQKDDKYSGIFLLLRQNELRPFVQTEMTGGRDLTHLSDLGAGNWGFRGPECEPMYTRVEFPTDALRIAAAQECQELKAKAPVGANWLAEQTLAWAKAHPEDPRLPQALHLVVQATRRGNTDAKSGDYSKQAFDVLHRQYPKSEWAAKTKYWFKFPH